MEQRLIVVINLLNRKIWWFYHVLFQIFSRLDMHVIAASCLRTIAEEAEKRKQPSQRTFNCNSRAWAQPTSSKSGTVIAISTEQRRNIERQISPHNLARHYKQHHIPTSQSEKRSQRRLPSCRSWRSLLYPPLLQTTYPRNSALSAPQSYEYIPQATGNWYSNYRRWQKTLISHRKKTDPIARTEFGKVHLNLQLERQFISTFVNNYPDLENNGRGKNKTTTSLWFNVSSFWSP